MKIQSTNSINFNGIFINQSHNNNGNWKMEYYPYCWENNNTGKMAPPEDITLFSYKLPDNEKIFHDYGQYKVALDVHDTTFYINDLSKDLLRSKIDEMPSMNREESLSVLKNKYRALLRKQEDALYHLHSYDKTDKVNEISENFNGWKRLYYEKSVFSNTRNQAVENMTTYKDEIVDKYKQLVSDMKNYIGIRNAMPSVESKINKLEEEVKTLKNARDKGMLIDISRRDIYDPNKALWQELQYNLKAALGKIVALPHMTISVKELMKNANATSQTKDVAMTVINYVDKSIAGTLHYKI